MFVNFLDHGDIDFQNIIDICSVEQMSTEILPFIVLVKGKYMIF